MAVTVYHYPKCSTCRRAIAWLRDRGVIVDLVDIVQSPPSKRVLKAVARLADRPPSKLFNTSGQSYRAGDFKTRMPTMSVEELFEALAADGKLIKRPLVVAEEFALVGFDEDAYAQRL